MNYIAVTAKASETLIIYFHEIITKNRKCLLTESPLIQVLCPVKISGVRLDQ
jgi:hypothetical protein